MEGREKEEGKRELIGRKGKDKGRNEGTGEGAVEEAKGREQPIHG